MDILDLHPFFFSLFLRRKFNGRRLWVNSKLFASSTSILPFRYIICRPELFTSLSGRRQCLVVVFA
jgi:hypothetical protein